MIKESNDLSSCGKANFDLSSLASTSLVLFFFDPFRDHDSSLNFPVVAFAVLGARWTSSGSDSDEDVARFWRKYRMAWIRTALLVDSLSPAFPGGPFSVTNSNFGTVTGEIAARFDCFGEDRCFKEFAVAILTAMTTK